MGPLGAPSDAAAVSCGMTGGRVCYARVGRQMAMGGLEASATVQVGLGGQVLV